MGHFIRPKLLTSVDYVITEIKYGIKISWDSLSAVVNISTLR